MLIGKLSIKILLPASYSLKDKRSVIKGIITKIQNKFKVSVAEVGENDIINVGFIGCAIIGNNTGYIDSVIESIINYIDGNSEVEIVEIDREIC